MFCLPLSSLKQVGGSMQVRLRRHELLPLKGGRISFQDICVIGDTNKSLSLFNLGGNEVKVTNVKKKIHITHNVIIFKLNNNILGTRGHK